MEKVFDAAEIPSSLRKSERDPSGIVLLWHAVRP
jgi:hypothetical protein